MERVDASGIGILQDSLHGIDLFLASSESESSKSSISSTDAYEAPRDALCASHGKFLASAQLENLSLKVSLIISCVRDLSRLVLFLKVLQ